MHSILYLNNALADCVTGAKGQLRLSLSLQLEAWHGACGGSCVSGVWAAKNPSVESLENNFMPCCRGLHLPSSQHKHPCCLAPAGRNQLKAQI